MPIIHYAFGPHGILEQTGTAEILLRRNLALPLERRKRLGYKISRSYMNPKTAFFIGSMLLPGLNHPVYQFRNAQNIFIGFGGQPQHEIELHMVPAPRKRSGAGIQNLLLREIFY